MELVVVILVLGVLASVAAPKMIEVSGAATDNSLKQTLVVVRDAIELYSAEHGGQFPGADKSETTFKANLASYLRRFPENPVGAKWNQLDKVKIRDSGDPLSGHIDNKKGWMYDNVSGEFRANTTALSCDGVTFYSAF